MFIALPPTPPAAVFVEPDAVSVQQENAAVEIADPAALTGIVVFPEAHDNHCTPSGERAAAL